MRDVDLPPARWIATALRTTTETLVSELHMPTATAPAWDRNEWQVARAVAAIHGISPLLADRLSWRGPRHWNEFLQGQREHTLRRHARILDTLGRIDDAARERGLQIVGLKGAALHHLGIYQPGERPMSDIDLLVRPCDRAAATRLIESLAYAFDYETWRHVVFQPRSGQAIACIGEHMDNPIKIELHTMIADQVPLTRCDISELVLPQENSAGLSFYRSSGALMAHLLIHAAGAMAAARNLRALHLHDIARTALTMTGRDWAELIALGRTGRLWWALPPLRLTSQYFPGVVPHFVLDDAESACPKLLRMMCVRRTLTDVSLSNPRIYAFPGIEWSRSVQEALRYMAARVAPPRDVLALRQLYGRYQSLGADALWVRSSQFARIARWMLGGERRTETMSSLRAAFID